MINIKPTAILFTVFLCALLAAKPKAIVDEERFLGNWALKMPNGDAGWLTLSMTDGKPTGELWCVGSTKGLREVTVVDETLKFQRVCRVGKPDYDGGPPTGKRIPCQHSATVKGDVITLVMDRSLTGGKVEKLIFAGKRIPPIPARPELSKIRFGKPIKPFNGRNLDGWMLSNSKQINGWKAIDGVLVNESPKETFEPYSRYGNLHTVRKFGDGRLEIEFNVPKQGNSGIYVRGAYEAQVVDRDSRMQGIQGPGSIFNRIEPSTNAGKPGGEWQRYEITIVSRHATVVLNGETVIENQPIVGNTNGAFQADVTIPGPLYLQGDHTAVKYRNIVFYPVIEDE